jgi:hypothetical protein
MKINNNVDLKYSIGEKIYYKHNNKIKNTHINKITIRTTLAKNKKPTTEIHYWATATHGTSYIYRMVTDFTEDKILGSEKDEDRIFTEHKIIKLKNDIKRINKAIQNNRKSMKEAKNKLDEIRKEELIERLSGV